MVTLKPVTVKGLNGFSMIERMFGKECLKEKRLFD